MTLAVGHERNSLKWLCKSADLGCPLDWWLSRHFREMFILDLWSTFREEDFVVNICGFGDVFICCDWWSHDFCQILILLTYFGEKSPTKSGGQRWCLVVAAPTLRPEGRYSKIRCIWELGCEKFWIAKVCGYYSN